ncbi:hypothetical protein JTB14_026542 [Gonioctena quinquepunctata]|nr:hypothetical protein JTB14_026542 [Gonioctena quinquepunctata]
MRNAQEKIHLAYSIITGFTRSVLIFLRRPSLFSTCLAVPKALQIKPAENKSPAGAGLEPAIVFREPGSGVTDATKNGDIPKNVSNIFNHLQ